MSSSQVPSPAQSIAAASAVMGTQELDMMTAHKRDIAKFSGSSVQNRSKNSGLTFNRQDGQFHYEVEGHDVGIVSPALIAAMNAHREALMSYKAILEALDVPGYDETDEDARERDRRDEAEETAAVLCDYLAATGSRADELALSDHASQSSKFCETLDNLRPLSKRLSRALGEALILDASASKPIATLIEDHREANAALNAINAETDPDAHDAAYCAERRAAVLLAARAADQDVTPEAYRHYEQYHAVYGQKDQHQTSLTWAHELEDDVLHCLRQHYRPEL